MLQVSSGFKSLILGPHAFEDIFGGGAIRVFSGPQPASADDPEQGTLLGLVTRLGHPWSASTLTGGLVFLRQGPFITNMPGDRWLLVPNATATAGWWRLVATPADSGGADYNAPRIDGAIGVIGGTDEMQLQSAALVVGNAVDVQSFFYTIPPIVGV